MRFASGIAALIALASLGACVTDTSAPEPQHRHHRHDGGDEARESAPRARVGLFISPAGKPYRAAPGEPYPSAAWFAAADADHDGKLTRKEFRADAAAFFHELDLNHDGVIDASEISAYERATPEIVLGFRPAQGGGDSGAEGRGSGSGSGRHGRHGGGGHGGSGRGGGGSQSAGRPADTRPQGAAWFSFLAIPEPVASADRNLDGRITLDEFLAAADDRFDLLDEAHAGFLTLETLPKTPVQRPGRRGDD
jgi:hypothetical protein